MYNFYRRKTKSNSSTKSSSSLPSSPTSSTSTNRSSMCRSPESHRNNMRRNKRSRSTSNGFLGMLRRPSWGGLVGLGGFRRIEDPDLRQSVLPRRPACMDLPSTKLQRQPNAMESGSDHSQQKNDRWDHLEFDANGQPQQKQKRLRLLEELQREPFKSKEQRTESQKWKALDDLVDMAYKIRVSDDHYDWDKLLEEDIEEEDSDMEPTASPSSSTESSLKQRQLVQVAKPQRRKAYEKPKIHLHQCHEDDLPAVGPGVLLA